MIDTIYRLKEFLSYQQRAQTKYYIHSPFVYQFYLNVLQGSPTPMFQNIKALHNMLHQNYNKISINDMGAVPGTKQKTVAQMATKASIPHKYGCVLFNILQYYTPQNVIELGTCLGLGTAYMALANAAAKIITIEGAESLSILAKQNFEQLTLKNIEQVTGNFDEKLPLILNRIDTIDLAFIDGNHRYEPTIRYFNLLMENTHENSILIFDDIYWSREMAQAWQQIKKDNRVTLSIDLYRLGIVFFHKDKLAKEDFTLRF